MFEAQHTEFNTRMAPGAQIFFPVWRVPIDQPIFYLIDIFLFLQTLQMEFSPGVHTPWVLLKSCFPRTHSPGSFWN